MADVDLDVLKERMAETIERAEADDPKKLRARIRRARTRAPERPPAEVRVESRRGPGPQRRDRQALTDAHDARRLPGSS